MITQVFSVLDKKPRQMMTKEFAVQHSFALLEQINFSAMLLFEAQIKIRNFAASSSNSELQSREK